MARDAPGAHAAWDCRLVRCSQRCALDAERTRPRLAERFADGAAVGVILHQAITDDERVTVKDLVGLVAGHTQTRATTILELSCDLREVSMRSGVPAGAETDRDLQRDRQLRCRCHLLLDHGSHGVVLPRRDLQDEFVVHLQQHP